MFHEQILLSSIFITGLLSFFAPCTFPLIPVYIGLLTDQEGEYKKLRILGKNINIGGMIKTIAFVLGLSTSFVLLGLGAGIFGGLLNKKWILFLAGFVVVLFGIHQMDIIHIKQLDSLGGLRIKNTKRKALGTYIMGVSFSLGWTPCLTPALGSIMVLSASQGTAAYGGFLMFIYSLGLMVPFLILSIFSEFVLKKFKFLEKHLSSIKKIGGGLIVLMGLALMFNQINSITAVIESIKHS